MIVLGRTGRNFAAGMSGGTAYVIDWDGDFKQKCNHEMVELVPLDDPIETKEIKTIVENHARLTDSSLAQRVLLHWEEMQLRFIKVLPKDYKQMLQAIRDVEAAGLSGDEAVMEAFEMNTHALLRIGGN